MSAIPRDAASVIILRRDAASPRSEALLIRRGARMAFAGGTWVFPGGKAEPSDGSAETLRRLGLAQEPDVKAMGLVVCGCRETFEEIGVVLARQASGAPCDAALAEKLQPFRETVSKDAGSFAAVLADHGLTIDLANSIFWSHWITPSIVERRFDTRFFVARMPPGQTVHADSAEATEMMWLGLASDSEGSSPLPDESIVHAPPTRFSLGDLTLSLRKHGGVDELMQAEASRRVVPIMPKMVRIDARMTAILPWDPDYPSAAGDGIPPDAQIPEQYLGFPSRIVPPKNISGMPS